MKKHGSLNHIYRLVWSQVLQTWVAVAENSKGRGKSKSSRSNLVASALSLLSLLCALPPAMAGPSATAPTALPTGYQVSAGSATISQTGNTLTVQENGQRAAINWQSFSIGANASVNFIQPNSSAIILDRVVGNDASIISGALNANGQVFILNSNGVLITKGATINTGALLASTLNISDSDFMAGRSTFTTTGTHSTITNQGSITAEHGGYVALIGNQVINQGVINARLGSAILASGDKVSLNFNGNSLVNVVISKGTLDALVSNQQAIYADGGAVILSAKAADSVIAAAVNNSGEIRAQTIGTVNGKIYLLADTGSVNVSGTLDASAPHGGNGGFIETSASSVQIANSAKVDSSSQSGLTGSWLIDPNDFTIAASGGSITGSALNTALGNGNVTISTTSGAASCSGGGISCTTGTAGSGNINVNDTTNPITWSSHTLTLSAYNNININAPMNGSGTAGLALLYGQGAVAANNTSNYFINAPVNLANTGSFSTKLGSNGSVINYTIITDLGLQNDAIVAPGTMTLQGMAASTSLAGNYVLGANIDASNTAGWNNGNGFTSIGAVSAGYTGKFDGLGHTVSNLTVAGSSNGGLFGANYGTISNVTVGGIIFSGSPGAVAGVNYGTINYSHSTATVVGDNAGGLVALNALSGVINFSSASGTINAGASTSGGLVGTNHGTINNSSSSAVINENQYTDGGLVGYNTGAINNCSSSSVMGSGAQYAGGIVGVNVGTISGTTFTGSVSGGLYTGGIVGYNGVVGNLTFNAAYQITNSSATGSVSGGAQTGGIAGINMGVINANSFSTATVTGNGNNMVGGLVGQNFGSISNSYANGTVTGGSGSLIGGVVGLNAATGTISASHSGATVTGYSVVGGLVGANYGAVSASYSSGSVTGTGNVGGLVGENFNSGTISASNSSATVAATGGSNGEEFGGLVGSNSNIISNSYATGNVTGHTYVGGLVGFTNSGSSITNSYATGSVQGGAYVGGLVGSNYGLVSNSYSTGAVTGTSDFGGLVGYNYGGTLSNSFYNVDQVVINSGHLLTAGGIFNSQYTDWFSHGMTLNIANYSGTLVPGTGGYYNVSTQQGLEDMLGFTENNAANNFRLAANITVTPGFFIPYFDGNFDGNGHTISGLNVNQPQNSEIGLFGYFPTGAGGISNLGVVNETLSGNSLVGGLVGMSYGSTPIVKSYTSGTVNGTGYSVGGLVGETFGGSISNSYSTANVTSAGSEAGGLVGYASSIQITNSYASGVVTGTGSVGAVVGSGSPTFSNTFYNSTANPTLSGLAGTPDVAGQVAGLTATQMNMQASFTQASNASQNWDFAGGTWFMYEGNTAPMLEQFLTPLTISGTSRQTYNGLMISGANAVTYSVTPNQSELLGTLTVSGGGTNVGTYSITPSGQWSDQQGYLITYTSGSLTILPAPLTITANNASKIYGQTATLSYVSSGLVNGQTIGSVTESSTGNAVTAGVAGSPYAITVSAATGGTFSASNYVISYVNGALTVNPLTLVVAAASGATRSYDGTANAPANLLTLSNLINGDVVTLSGNGTLAGSAVGNEALTGVGGLTVNNPNYTLSQASVSGSVLITAAPSPAPNPASDLTNLVAAAQTSAHNSVLPIINVSTPTLTSDNRNGNGVVNVASVTPQLAAAFGDGVRLAVVSSPGDNELTEVVSISEARTLLQSPSDSNGPSPDGSQGTSSPSDVRVPVSRNSLAEIVNGGVRLPTGVEQQLFVVKGSGQ